MASVTSAGADFSDPALWDRLEAASPSDLDGWEFGVIRMDTEGRVTGFNRNESEAAGLKPERVMGRHFFSEVAPCTLNADISQPMLQATTLDTELDYVFALRMKLTPVRLRMLKRPDSDHMYLLVQR